MKVLVLSSVYPNHRNPTLGVFVRERTLRLARLCEMRVIAPVPWFPGSKYLRKNYRLPVQEVEVDEELIVYHPKFFSVPGILKCLDGLLMFLSLWRTAVRMRKEFDFDIIDAHFAYPEGLAAVLLGKTLGRRVTITLRGTIVPLSRYRLRKFQIRYALERASMVFSVCEALKRKAVELGVHPEKIDVVPNGVDTQKFSAVPKDEARRNLALPLNRKIILSAGALVKRKGFHRVIEALPGVSESVPDFLYVIVGGPSVEGDYSEALHALATKLHLEENVFFAGPVQHTHMREWLSAADVFCLPSSNEGWANVLLESLACGVPVVATNVGGNGEVIRRPDLGIIVAGDQPDELANALVRALRSGWNKEQIVSYAKQYSWEKAARSVMHRFECVAKHTDGATAPHDGTSSRLLPDRESLGCATEL